MKSWLLFMGQQLLPLSARRWLVRSTSWPPVGMVRFGSFRRLNPLSRDWGEKRGQPVDRYYIEKFLAENASNIQGHVLEIANNAYTKKFGGDRVTRSDVMHPVEGNPNATIVADLISAGTIQSNTFDCIVCTQTLQYIYDVKVAIRTLYRILKPGGILLVTIPGISQVSREDMEQWGDYWRFTSATARRLFEDVAGPVHVKIQVHGNVLTSTCFLHGMASEELTQDELDYIDPDYELLITVRVEKPEASL